jgi:cellulose biosynthesis protein BcsQ
MDQVDRQRAKVGQPPVPWMCVFNRVQVGTKENQAMAEQLVTRVALVPAVLGDRIAYRRAIAAGESALTYRPRDLAAAQEAWALFEAVLSKTPLAGHPRELPEALRDARKRTSQRAA